jgi:hypothetical protein
LRSGFPGFAAVSDRDRAAGPGEVQAPSNEARDSAAFFLFPLSNDDESKSSVKNRGQECGTRYYINMALVTTSHVALVTT